MTHVVQGRLLRGSGGKLPSFCGGGYFTTTNGEYSQVRGSIALLKLDVCIVEFALQYQFVSFHACGFIIVVRLYHSSSATEIFF